jgi:hypothetical protein
MTKPLSAAQVEERRAAARKRWALAAAAGAGTAAGAGVNTSLRNAVTTQWQQLRRAHQVGVGREDLRHAHKLALIGKRQAMYGRAIRSGWPVPAAAAVQFQHIREAVKDLKAQPMFRDEVGEAPADQEAWEGITDRISASRQKLRELATYRPSSREKVAAQGKKVISAHTRTVKPKLEIKPEYLAQRAQDLRNHQALLDEIAAHPDYQGERLPDPPKVPRRYLRRVGGGEFQVKQSVVPAVKAHTRVKPGNIRPKDLADIKNDLSFRLKNHTYVRQTAEAAKHAANLAAERQAFRGRARMALKYLPRGRARLALSAGLGLATALGTYVVAKHAADRLSKADDDDQPGHLQAAADDAEPTLAKNLAENFRDLKDNTTADLRSPGGSPLLESVKAGYDAATKPLVGVMERALGAPVDAVVPGEDGDDRIVTFALKTRGPNAQRYIEDYRQNRIVQLTENQADSIKSILVESAKAGSSPQEIARRVRQNIGLTAYQTFMVDNYRDELERLDPAALQRQLRDKRFDGIIEKATADGGTLTTKQIDAAVDAYHRKFLAYRAMTIARTEGVGAANNAHVAGVRAFLEAHPDYDVEKTWMARMDKHTRHDHKELNGETVMGIDTPFTTRSGEKIRWPHDPNASAKEVINCRCFPRMRLVHRQSTSFAQGTIAT